MTDVAKGNISDKGVISKNWEDSPCSLCKASWCCTHLPLLNMKVINRQDWIKIMSLADYNHVLWGLKDDGTWTLYLHRPCTNLKPGGQGCKLHGKAEQPWICKRFSPHRCWYQRAFPQSASLLMIQWDSLRLSWLEDRITFSKEGQLEDVPSWKEMMNSWKGKKILLNHKQNGPDLLLPIGPQKTERDRDIINYKLCFPGVAIHTENNFIINGDYRLSEFYPWQI